MGLYIHNLSHLPMDFGRDYYLYVLDYGWDEPLGEALRINFRRMADLAAKHKAIVLAGTDSRSFTDQALSAHVDDAQFSWSNINGVKGEDILPALMISNIHPQRFREENPNYRPIISKMGAADEKLVIIPLRGVCSNSTDVMALIERIFRDIAAGKPLSDFAVAKEIMAGKSGAISDAFILKPSLWGVGVDLKELLRAFSAKRA